ncbi:hypothetical protein A3768_4580 (plasmid) [Ralstonia solanacearum]|nr:hypothetical protein A3768_4580 [Ralstonia solanacearum]
MAWIRFHATAGGPDAFSQESSNGTEGAGSFDTVSSIQLMPPPAT